MKILQSLLPVEILLIVLLLQSASFVYGQDVECVTSNGPVSESANGSSCDADASSQSYAEADATNLSEADSIATDQSTADASSDISSSADAAASGQSNADSDAFNNSTADTGSTNGSSSAADASNGSQASATADGLSQATGSAEQASEAFSESSGQSSAETCAEDNSNASAEGASNSSAIAASSDGSSTNAQAQTVGDANAFAEDQSSADAFASSGTAYALAQNNSLTFAETENNNSAAKAVACDNGAAIAAATNGGYAYAFAQNGGEAEASDTAPPVCSQTGTASVRSSAGNCGPDSAWSACGGIPITFLPGSVSCAVPACSNNVSISGSMEGNLPIRSGDTLRAGFDFTVPGNHPADSVTFFNGLVVLLVECPDKSSVTLSISIPNQTITDPANDGGDWFPSNNQSSPLVYQGSITVPEICGGATGHAPQGAAFTADLAATATNSVHVRFHYSDATSGSWSGTQGYCQ